MTTTSYIEQSKDSESIDFERIAKQLGERHSIRLLHATMGAATEAGELLDAIKKHIFYGRAVDDANLKEEAGDLLWYLAVLFDEMNWTFEGVMATNIAKLRVRYPEKFREYDAIHRDLSQERAVLEAGE
jgi:NTP pyrophosphatase (non-canonical NTP hydrolase)